MDKRKVANKKVKDNLLKALIELSQNKKWSNITVTELINKSSVARSSFYRNFETIEDIIDYGIGKIVEEYNQENPSQDEDFHDRELILFKFQFYKKHSDLILNFHHSQMSKNLLTIIDDFVIDYYGDMPSSSISKYKLYYYSGAFYNIVIHWLEDGMKETPEDMANEFIHIVNGNR